MFRHVAAYTGCTLVYWIRPYSEELSLVQSSHTQTHCFPQVLSRKLYLPAIKARDPSPPKIVSVDLQPMAPIEGVTQLQGDITSEETATAVRFVEYQT